MRKKLKIKICGINDKKSAKASKGADFIGFVFYQKSSRFITSFEARKLSECLEKNQKKVGLFVNSDINLIKHISDYVKLDMIQLHGNESVDAIKSIRQIISKPIIKAIHVSSETDIQSSKKYENVCDILLFDTKVSDNNVFGGSGLSFDWEMLKNFRSKKKWILAGGLNIDNVKDAITKTGAEIIDISSGVEKEKGVKCTTKIKKLIQYVKESNFQ